MKLQRHLARTLWDIFYARLRCAGDVRDADANMPAVNRMSRLGGVEICSRPIAPSNSGLAGI